MASPVGTLRVDLAANTAQFAAGMDAARAKIVQFQQAGTKASASAGALGTEFSRMGRSIAGNRFALQNAAFQVGDFATQVAGGTSATRALSQQMPQLLGSFGVFGAVAGAAFAILAPLVGKLFEGADAASQFRTELDAFNPSISSVRSGLDQLRDLQEKYVAAIRATGGASASAADAVVANTAREIAVRKQILDLEIRVLQARQADKRAEIASFKSQVDAQLDAAVREGKVARDIFENFAGSPGADAPKSRELPEATQPIKDFLKANETDLLKLRGLQAEAKLADIEIEKLREGLDAVFDDPGGGTSGASGGGGGGGGGGSARSQQTRQLTEDLKAASVQAEYFTSIQDDMKQGFLDAILEGKNFGDVIDDIAKSLARAALESALFNTGPWAAAGGGGGLLGAIFGGFRAEGGPVSPGKAYMVGERGPEIIVPSMGGTVIPNEGIADRSGVDVRVFVDEGGNWQAAVERISGNVSTAVVAQNNRRLREAQRR